MEIAMLNLRILTENPAAKEKRITGKNVRRYQIVSEQMIGTAFFAALM